MSTLPYHTNIPRSKFCAAETKNRKKAVILTSQLFHSYVVVKDSTGSQWLSEP